MHIIKRLAQKNLISPPGYVIDCLQYLTITGSVAYGVADTTDKENMSDIDLVGFCIPHKDMIFPHLRGEIPGFGRQLKRFNQYQPDKIKDLSTKKEYDITVYNIIKFFQLCLENNPNMIDTLFTPRNCILYSSPIGEYVREYRKTFLHKGCWHRFRGYAYAQLHKLKSKKILEYINLCEQFKVHLDTSKETFEKEIEKKGSTDLEKLSFDNIKQLLSLRKQCGASGKLTKRVKSIKKHKYDVKFGYHLVRLLEEAEMLLTEHDLDIQRNRELLKSIRRGEWSLEKLEEYFNRREKELQTVYDKSTLRYSPDEKAIRNILYHCLEMQYGSLSNAIVKPDQVIDLINDLQEIVDKYRVIR